MLHVDINMFYVNLILLHVDKVHHTQNVCLNSCMLSFCFVCVYCILIKAYIIRYYTP